MAQASGITLPASDPLLHFEKFQEVFAFMPKELVGLVAAFVYGDAGDSRFLAALRNENF
jgi:hypothetical protein